MSNRAHHYRITLTPVGNDPSASPEAADPLVFMHENHDDLKLIVERARQTSGLDPDAAAAMAVGLKLLAEVMLKQRGNPLFDVLRDPIREFIQSLKSRSTHGTGR